jgi:hypothetical protein
VTPDGQKVISTGWRGRELEWDLDLPAVSTPTSPPSPMPVEVDWPGGKITVCESGDYAAVIAFNDLIPCKVESATNR